MQQSSGFAPQLWIPAGITDVSFYTNAFGAKEIRRFSNDDGSIHVVEFTIHDQCFYVHEVNNPGKYFIEPGKANHTTVTIALFVEDVHAVMAAALAAGATLIIPAEDHFYGLRQGNIRDPFGHDWIIQQHI
ncbi:MAG: VOC family protein [Bacteroidetes bacterium]|nr:VOC family protein [Bacteroidota bacterium]